MIFFDVCFLNGKGSFGIIFQGEKDKTEVFKIVHRKTDIMFIILRFLGLFFMVVGFSIIGHPLQLLLAFLPFVGRIWELVIFKIMQVIGSFVAICISSFYWLKYNSFSNISIYDFYFLVAVALFLILCNSLSVTISVNGEEVYDADF